MRHTNHFVVTGYVDWHGEQGNFYTVLVTNRDDYYNQKEEQWVERRYKLFVRYSGKLAEGLSDRIGVDDLVTVEGKITTYESTKNGDGQVAISLIGTDLIVVQKSTKDKEKPTKAPQKSGTNRPSPSPKKAQAIKDSNIADDLWGDSEPWDS